MKCSRLSRQAALAVEGFVLYAWFRSRDSRNGRTFPASKHVASSVRSTQIAFELERASELTCKMELLRPRECVRVNWIGRHDSRPSVVALLPSNPQEREQMWVDSAGEYLMRGGIWFLPSGRVLMEFGGHRLNHSERVLNAPSPVLVVSDGKQEARNSLYQVGTLRLLGK